MKNNLTPVVPAPNEWRLLSSTNYSVPFNINMLDDVPWHRQFVEENKYDISALHARWNASEFE